MAAAVCPAEARDHDPGPTASQVPGRQTLDAVGASAIPARGAPPEPSELGTTPAVPRRACASSADGSRRRRSRPGRAVTSSPVRSSLPCRRRLGSRHRLYSGLHSALDSGLQRGDPRSELVGDGPAGCTRHLLAVLPTRSGAVVEVQSQHLKERGRHRAQVGHGPNEQGRIRRPGEPGHCISSARRHLMPSPADSPGGERTRRDSQQRPHQAGQVRPDVGTVAAIRRHVRNPQLIGGYIDHA